MEWIHSSEEECSWLWVKMPGLNSVVCGPGPQCLRKHQKQQKVLSVSLVSQWQNWSCTNTQNSQQSCRDGRLMPVMFLVTSEKCPNHKSPNSSLSETRTFLRKLQCEVKHSSLKSQDWSLGGSPSMGPVWMCTSWMNSHCSQLLLLPCWDGYPGHPSAVPGPPCQTFPGPDSGCGPELRAAPSHMRLLNLEAALYFRECKQALSTTKLTAQG